MKWIERLLYGSGGSQEESFPPSPSQEKTSPLSPDALRIKNKAAKILADQRLAVQQESEQEARRKQEEIARLRRLLESYVQGFERKAQSVLDPLLRKVEKAGLQKVIDNIREGVDLEKPSFGIDISIFYSSEDPQEKRKEGSWTISLPRLPATASDSELLKNFRSKFNLYEHESNQDTAIKNLKEDSDKLSFIDPQTIGFVAIGAELTWVKDYSYSSHEDKYGMSTGSSYTPDYHSLFFKILPQEESFILHIGEEGKYGRPDKWNAIIPEENLKSQELEDLLLEIILPNTPDWSGGKSSS